MFQFCSKEEKVSNEPTPWVRNGSNISCRIWNINVDISWESWKLWSHAFFICSFLLSLFITTQLLRRLLKSWLSLFASTFFLSLDMFVLLALVLPFKVPSWASGSCDD